jgi:hypothetical protein
MSESKARRYVNGGTVPKTVPPSRVLVHNHVIHGTHWPCGVNGFLCEGLPQEPRRIQTQGASDGARVGR